MTDDEMEPASRGGRWTILRWLSILAALASIVGTVIAVLQWVESRPKTNASASPTPTVSKALTGDDRFIQVGQCVRNLGDAQTPLMKIADCGPGTLRVVARIEQKFNQDSEADAACEKQAPGFTDYHFSNWTQDSSISVVFCLQAE